MSAAPSSRRPLVIGLVNNMPDAALRATERQFEGLLRAAAGDGTPVRLALFALPQIERGASARALMLGRYATAAQVRSAGLDGLIVTGAEPKAAELDGEPYWDALAALVDWTEATAVPSLWSCLAAHAAVLRQGGVCRRPLPAKLSGVFAFHRAADDDLTAELPVRTLTPHSRLNGLAEADLTAAGYRVLTRSAEAGVDAFVRRSPSLALFLQGHPEYDADSLIREYCRDVGRFLRGERDTHPATPCGAFDTPAALAFEALARRARRRRDSQLIGAYLDIARAVRPAWSWREGAVALFRGWLQAVAAARSGREPALAWAGEGRRR